MVAKFTLLGAMLLAFAAAAEADSHTGRYYGGAHLDRVQSHAGQVDTDGILSPGEIRNPNIDYERAQQEGRVFGDPRVNNPSNDAAADAERYFNYQSPRGQYRWDDRRNDDRYYDDHYYDDHRRRDDGRSWWPW